MLTLVTSEVHTDHVVAYPAVFHDRKESEGGSIDPLDHIIPQEAQPQPHALLPHSAMLARFASTASARATAPRCQQKASHRCLRVGGTNSYSSVSSIDIAERTKRLLRAKADSGLTYDELAAKLGVTNTYAAQILLGQAKLTEETASKLRGALPMAPTQDILDLQASCPMRGFDEQILKEPNVYRTYEAITHYGEAIKSIINEQCGDGEFEDWHVFS